MNLKNIFKVTALFIFLNFTFISLAHTDTYIKRKKHTDSYKVMGQTVPAKDEITITWMAKDKGRIDTGDDNSMIIRLDKNIIYLLDHTTMSYTEMPVGGISQMFGGEIIEEDMEEDTEEDQEQIEEMEIEPKITDTGEKKVINGWKCRKYILEMDTGMGMATSEIWATEDIKIDYNHYQKISNAMMLKGDESQDITIMLEIKGIPVLTVNTTEMMGFKYNITDEILEVKEKSVPSNIYEIPKDYVKTEQDLKNW